jgi:LCP family protein required for cell wall assembly
MKALDRLARPAEGPGHRRRRRPFIAIEVLVVILVLLYFCLDVRLHRVDALGNWKDRPADRPAQDWLLVGSDGGGNIEPAQRRAPAMSNRRADTIMLLHVPARGGRPTLVIFPLNLSTAVPGGGSAHYPLEAIYAAGGPKLLTRTVESLVWLRVDRYLEVRFADFVDRVGGVRICTGEPVRSIRAGPDRRPGCRNLTGRQAVDYARAHGDRNALDQAGRQRSVVAALAGTATSPRTLLDPFRGIPLAWNEICSVMIGRGDHLHNLIRLASIMHKVGEGVTIATVPIAGFAATPDGTIAHWQWEGTRALFGALQMDRPVPANLRIG